MFQAPPLLLTLSLTILHFHFYNAIPVGEEQRHQPIHQNAHDSPAYPSEAVDHQEASLLPRSQHEKREGNDERESTQMLPATMPDEGDELFKDISPKALAAVLLQALNSDGEEQTPSTSPERTPPGDHKALKDEKEDGLTERVKTRSQSLEREDELREDAKVGNEEDLESVKSLLQEFESFQSPPKAEQEIEQQTRSDSDDLEELKELLGIGSEIEEEKRSPIQPDAESSKKWGEEEESDNLAGVAQDLLLQYVLNGAENEEEQGKEEKNQEQEGSEEAADYQGGDIVEGQRPMFEDEEDANILEKRSNDDDDDEIDPQTIDKLIELSSRLHLPADDVVDIIADVERRKRRRMKKKKARDDFLGRKERTRAPPQSWPDTPKPAYYPRRRLEQEPVWNKVQDPVWNKVPEPIWSKKKEPRWNKWADPNWNKLQEPRWDKVQQPSWNKVQQPSWNKVQQPSWNIVQQPSWKKMQEPNWKKMQDPNWNKVQDYGNKVQDYGNKVQDSNWNKVQDSNWNKVQDSNWNKVHDSSWNKLPESSWNEIEKPSWNKAQKSSWDNMEDSSWNKVKQPSWKKVMQPPPRRYRTRPSSFSNYIRPRAFQSPPRYYYKPPPPQIDDYFDEDKARQEEMENYIERLLLTHPEVFQ